MGERAGERFPRAPAPPGPRSLPRRGPGALQRGVRGDPNTPAAKKNGRQGANPGVSKGLRLFPFGKISFFCCCCCLLGQNLPLPSIPGGRRKTELQRNFLPQTPQNSSFSATKRTPERSRYTGKGSAGHPPRGPVHPPPAPSALVIRGAEFPLFPSEGKSFAALKMRISRGKRRVGPRF